ncbi:Stu1p [Sugiyamaella lignohabitans]|uniref:Protein STU1 n=1 Tax=Sugiyamaella lignohabitans TaxID=796027 RepID=A0A167DAN2_9ASCO|nr:Stu1p [Sugiyamaella lignohabitans]ANB12684.1 Stu1p [Sugiyamaella lignohabitans]
MCHLIKRVILQNPEALQGPPAHIALPLLIDKFSDAKPSLRTTARRVFEDYWMSCPAESEMLLRSVGFVHPDERVRFECVDMLSARIHMVKETRFVFRPFTASVVALLSDTSEEVRNAAFDLLVSFFQTAHIKAKQDLNRELVEQGTNSSTQRMILREIGLDTSDSRDLRETNRERPGSANSSRLGRALKTTRPISGTNNTTSTIPSTSSTLSSSANSMGASLATSTTSTSGNGSSVSSLSTAFVTEMEGYKMDEINGEDVSSSDSFKIIVEDMAPCFDGKETEFNWSKREKSIIRLRSLLRGNAPSDFPDAVIWMFKSFSDGFVKAICSLRTSLSNHGCQFIKEGCMIMTTSFDSVVEPYLSNLVRITQGAKKISAQVAAMVINALVINTSYSIKFLNHIQMVVNDKVPQAKVYAAIWTRLIISTHGSKAGGNGGDSLLEKIILKGISDANPAVREGMRLAFWDYYTVWSKSAETALSKMDNTTKKAVERVRPQGMSASHHAPLKVTRSLAANRPPIREFIAKSREAGRGVTKEPVLVANKKPLRLKVGMVGGSGAATSSHPPASSTSVASSTVSASQYGKKHVPSINPHNPTTHGPEHGYSQTGNGSTHNSTVNTASSLVSGSHVGHANNTLKKTRATPDIEVAPSVTEMLQSRDDTKFTTGVRALTYLLRGKDPAWEINCQRPATLPTPEVIESSLKRVFAFDDNNGEVLFRHHEHLSTLCEADLIGSVLQFVGVKNILYGASYNLEGEELENSLHSLRRLLISSDAFTVLVELVGRGQSKQLILELAKSVSENLDSNANVSEAIQTLGVTDFQGRELELVTDIYNTLKERGLINVNEVDDHETKPVAVENTTAIETDEVNTESDSILAQDKEQEDVQQLDDIHVEEPEKVDELIPEEKKDGPVKSVSDTEEESKGNDPEIPSQSPEDIENASKIEETISEQDTEAPLEIATEVTEDLTRDIASESTEALNVSEVINTESTPIVGGDIAVPDTEPALENVDEEDVDMDITADNDTVVKEQNNEVDTNIEEDTAVDNTEKSEDEEQQEETEQEEAEDASEESIEITGMTNLTIQAAPLHAVPTITTSPHPPKLSIFEDSKSSSSGSNTPEKSLLAVQTPIKLRENVNSILSWHAVAAYKNVCSSPLPQTDEDANQLYKSLIHQIDSRTIDSHGLRKLITIVKGAKSADSNAGIIPAYSTWRQGKWLVKLQNSILSYISRDDLSENETNQSLLLVYQLLEAEPAAFDNVEVELIKSFSTLAGVSSPIIGLGALADTTALLVSKCNRDGIDNIELRMKMISGLITVNDNAASGKLPTNATSNANEVSVFIVSAINQLLSSSTDRNSLEEHVRSLLPALASIIMSYIGHEETKIRKETYPLVVTLRQLVSDERDKEFLQENVIGQLSTGQRQLLDFFCK